MTQDEMIGSNHQLNGHGFKQTLGDGEGQGSLTCCSPWGLKEQLNNNDNLIILLNIIKKI